MAKKSPASRRSPKDWAPNVRILKTPAYDNHGYEYPVFLDWTTKDQYGVGPDWILHVDGTPGHWFMTTLMSHQSGRSEIYVDHGQGWKIINFSDVMREAVTRI